MSEYLLMWTLASVQPFIAAARKTQDLWIGSYLLSYLMEAVFAAADTAGADIIYPTSISLRPLDEPFEANPYIADLPNLFVAHCANSTIARSVAGQAQQALYKRWNETQQRVWKNIVTAVPDMQKAEMHWHMQTKPEVIFDSYWVAVSHLPNQEPYGETFKELRNALNDRKRLRAFVQIEHSGEKSTITGEHAALQIPGSTRQQVADLWRRVGRSMHYGHRFIRADGSERLSAVDTVKRLAASGDDRPLNQIDFNRFPSTSTIAAAPFFQAMLDRWSRNPDIALQTIRWFHALRNPIDLGMADQGDARAMPRLYRQIEQFPPDDLRQRLLKQDGDTFFAAMYTIERLRRDFGLPNDLFQQRTAIEAQCRNAVSELQKLIGLVRAADVPRIAPPSPYFAILVMDGDGIGTTIGNVPDQMTHKRISATLSSFARERVPAIVEQQHLARLIYAGGDDVLALAPLEEVLALAETLRTAFTAALQGIIKDRRPSASIGICIAHHQDPLGRSVRAARAAEEAAKKSYKRNSIVVTLLRRSGERTSVGAPWHDQADIATMDVLLEILSLFHRERLSPKFAYFVGALAPTLANLPLDAQRSEVKRLLLRQRNGEAALSKEDAKTLAAKLVAVSQAIEAHISAVALPTELRDEGPRRGIVEVSGWLSLLAFMARGERS